MKNLFSLFGMLIFFGACTNIGAFEKNVQIPGNSWSSSFKPEIAVDITDTVSEFKMYVVIRHTNAYAFNNIWLNIETTIPGTEQKNKQRFDLRLATDDRGWLGTGMDDIFEHRILITPVKFPRSGKYIFKFENIMRQDPLEHVMNIGLRLEKSS